MVLEASFAQLDTDGKQIIGVAVLGCRLYVVCVSNNTVFVFDNQPPYRRVDGFQVSGMNGPGDLGASATSLYVVNWASTGVTLWRVSPTDRNGFQVTDAAHWTGTLSMSENDNVIGVTGTGHLQIVDGIGKRMLINITLPPGIRSPQHAVAGLQTGRYFVSHGWRMGTEHRICDIDSLAGVIVRCYGNMSGNGTGELHWPRHLAVGVEEKTLYAIDYFNFRVVAFDAETLIPHEENVLTGNVNGTHFPQRLRYSVTTRNGQKVHRLIVGMSLASLVPFKSIIDVNTTHT